MSEAAKVIIPSHLTNPPEAHEIDAAWILAKHYNTRIEFLRPVAGYKIKTPDIVMSGLLYEIKSPTGSSRKHTVKHQFDKASAQHAYGLIFDCRRTKLPDSYLVNAIKYELGTRRRIKKVIVITKNKILLEII